MKICMIGSGYVGLVSGVCFATLGFHVTCIDNDAGKIAALNAGKVPIYEPGLDTLLAEHLAAKRIAFSTDLGAAVRTCDLIFIAVGTPTRRGDGHADLSYIQAALDEIAPHINDFKVIATKSTVPVGSSRMIEKRLRGLRPDADFAVCSNPEFLREGAAIADFMEPDRVLVGVDEPRAQALLEKLYAPIAAKGVPILFTGRESAELAKYAANAFLALKVCFINEIADLCEKVGADVTEVAGAIGKDKRIGERFLGPGPGFGGSCFPKDVQALIRTAREAEAELTIVEQLQHVNEERKIAMANRITRLLGGSVEGKRIAIFGVTFKANTDDMRGAPSLIIVPILQQKGASVVAYDPQGREKAEPLLPGMAWADTPLAAAHGADAVVVLTEWAECRAVDLRALKGTMNGSVLADLRNIYIPDTARALGFIYDSVGRPG
jgi:UDPglucose 6-dehydrogenase